MTTEGEVIKAESRQSSVTGLTIDRLQALSDGVIAIVITILVLGIDVPPPDETGIVKLHRKLSEDWIMFAGYFVSFLLIGLYWLIHHTLFHYFTCSDRILSSLNLLFLMFIAFIPFPTSLMISYPNEPLAAQLYAGAHVLTSLSLAALWIYGTSGYRLVDRGLDLRVARSITRRLLIGPSIYAASFAIAFLDATVAKAIFLVVPVVYILPRESETHWLSLRGNAPDLAPAETAPSAAEKSEPMNPKPPPSPGPRA